jgi:PAS domain S-box-containing protein
METIDALRNQNAALTAENNRLREEARQLAEVTRAFQESQNRFCTVFEASRLGNKIINAELEILQVNAALVKLLGYSSKDDIIGTAILNYSPPERHEEWRYLQQQLWQQSSSSFSLETVLIRKGGSFVWCQVTSILFMDNDEILGYTIIEDITEQYKLRQQKDEFISVASHELKTPFTSLKATLQIMNRMLDKEDGANDKLRQLAKGAERSSVKLNYLIADLLNSTKISQGQLALNCTTFSVGELIESCCSHIELEGTYSLEFEGDRAAMVYGDQQKIEQVLINLINNAIKYAPGSLAITLRVEVLEAAIKMTVTDHGPGIRPEHLSQLFDRYFRVNEKRHDASGLGLGLYISAEIIRRHGGTIGVDSELGKGASFWFTLPRHTDMPADLFVS